MTTSKGKSSGKKKSLTDVKPLSEHLNQYAADVVEGLREFLKENPPSVPISVSFENIDQVLPDWRNIVVDWMRRKGYKNPTEAEVNKAVSALLKK